MLFRPVDPESHLLDIPGLPAPMLEAYLNRTGFYAEKLANGGVDRSTLSGKTILNLFFEPSTRTRTSFEMAAYRLGANIVNWDPDGSAARKGESFTDIIQSLAALRPDGIIIRHAKYNTPHMVAQIVDCPVINAGDSWRAHPTQALADAYTILQRKGRIGGLTVAICGDVAQSRVAACNIALLTRLGATVNLIAPPNFLPPTLPHQNVAVFTDMDEGIRNADVIMMLHLQKDRLDMSAFTDTVGYHHAYGLTGERLRRCKGDVIVLHPGPLNRGLEIADDVADDPHHSLILQQAANTLPTRMAVLDILLNEKGQ